MTCFSPRAKWFNDCGNDFCTIWLPVSDICNIVFDYLIPLPHQFDDSKTGLTSNVTIGKDGLSAQFQGVYSGIMTKLPLSKTSSTIRFRMTRLPTQLLLHQPMVWIGLFDPNKASISSVSNTRFLPGQWLISRVGHVVNGKSASLSIIFNFHIDDVITLDCDMDAHLVSFRKNNLQSFVAFRDIPNLSDLHFCVEGSDFDIAIEN